MDFYSGISKYYDYIFPLDRDQLDFIKYFIYPANNRKILDIGCATGSLSIELANLGYAVYGIDNDDMMIRAAVNKKAIVTDGKYPVFEKTDMLYLSSAYSNNFFDAVICFGNTLVHLADNKEIYGFLQSLNSLLKQNGLLLIQILNYNYILENKIDRLPSIENEKIIFDRIYEYGEQYNINFYTKLTIKEENSIVENRIKLYPLKKEDIEIMLLDAGFKEIEFYGNFNKEALKEKSLPLILKCVK